MDTFTHALSGAVAARALAPHGWLGADARLPRIGAWTTAGAVAAVFPDIDFVLGLVDRLLYLHHHRGLTHSLLMLPLWALLLGWLFARVAGERDQMQAFAAVAALGIGMHVLGDLITPYGTMILAPLSRRSFELGTTFIIDPWMTAMLVVALAGMLLWRPRWAAVLGLVAVAAYVIVQAHFKAAAHELARAHAERVGLAATAASVYPQPLSPLNWKLIVAHQCSAGCGYEIAHVNLWRRGPARVPDGAGWLSTWQAAYRPPDALRWVYQPAWVAGPDGLAAEAWRRPELARYRAFARYPVVHRIRQSPAAECAWFRDLRFDLPGRTPPFRYGMCRDPADDRWTLSRLGIW